MSLQLYNVASSSLLFCWWIKKLDWSCRMSSMRIWRMPTKVWENALVRIYVSFDVIFALYFWFLNLNIYIELTVISSFLPGIATNQTVLALTKCVIESDRVAESGHCKESGIIFRISCELTNPTFLFFFRKNIWR